MQFYPESGDSEQEVAIFEEALAGQMAHFMPV